MKFQSNAIGNPVQKVLKLQWKSIGNPVEITLRFHLKSIGNPLKISMKYQLISIGSQVEISMIYLLKFQLNTCWHFNEILMEIHSKFSWNSIEILKTCQ